MSMSPFADWLAQQGRVQAIARVTSGSPEVIDVIAATLAMVKRGTTILRAKRALEKALIDDLETAGMAVTFRGVIGRDLKEHFSVRLKPGSESARYVARHNSHRTAIWTRKPCKSGRLARFPTAYINGHLIRMKQTLFSADLCRP